MDPRLPRRRPQFDLAPGILCATGLTLAMNSVWGVELEHDFGRLLPSIQAPYRFAMTNLGSQTLRLDRFEKSCSCVEVLAWPNSVEIGQTATIAVRLHTANSRGNLHESVRFLAPDGRPALTLNLSAKVQAPVEATPEFVTFRPDPQGATRLQSVALLTNYLNTPVFLTNAISLTERFAATLEPTEAGRSYRLRIEAIPPFNSGNTFGAIRIATGLTNFPFVEVTTFVPSRRE